MLETQQKTVPVSQWVIDLFQSGEQSLPFYRDKTPAPLMTSFEHCV